MAPPPSDLRLMRPRSANGGSRLIPPEERRPTSPFDHVVVDGVQLVSRWQRAEEIDRLTALVQALPPFYRLQIKAIYCESEGGRRFQIVLRAAQFTQARAVAVAREVESILLKQLGGHDGVSIGRHDLPPRSTEAPEAS
jgi:hypothetical protein